MTYQKQVTADVDPAAPYSLNFQIPDPQKQALYQALMTLVTVALSIAFTLVAQFVGQAMDITPPEPVPVVDQMQTLAGTTHFTELSVEEGINVEVGDENFGLPSVISTDIVYSTATGAVATIPAGQKWIVHAVFIEVTSNFNCTGDDCALTIGDGNDPDGFLAAADAQLQTTFTEATGYPAGWYGLENGSNGAYTVDEGLFVYDVAAAETIDYAIGGTSPAGGAATVYVIYTRIL